MTRFSPRWILLAAVLAPGASPALAQQRGLEQSFTADGIRLDFPADAVWRKKGRRVVAYRRALRSAGRFEALNAPVITGAALAGPVSMAGTLMMPSVLLSFSDTDTTTLSDAVDYDSLFYTTQPLTGRPYTLRTFYEEVSDGMFSVGGNTYGWVPVDSSSGNLLGHCGMGNDPIGCTDGREALRAALGDALTSIDGSVDFSMYDNDGPDNVPNSGDDDGVVDIVQFLQPLVGRECSGTGYNAHRFSLSGLDFSAGAYTTDDAASGGGMIEVNAYYITAGVGGPNCSNASQIMPIGTSAHELGHGFDLPDLYDTNPNDSDNSEGIGEWGLMGSGNFTSLNSPTHLSAWSKEQLGWVAVRELTADGTYSFGPVVNSDTVFMIRPVEQSALDRGEYYLLENKQSVGSDTSNMTSGGNAGPKLGGLVVMHIDSTKIASNTLPFANSVNTGPIHGVAMLQADGAGNLDNSTNRGDAGDPFPGTSLNTSISFNTSPALTNNSDGGSAGFEITSITQVVPGGAMSFDLTFGGPTIVRASDTNAVIQVDAVNYNRFAQRLNPGQMYALNIATTQTSSDGRTQFTFNSWSDGGAQSHNITGTLAGDSISALVDRSFRVMATVSGNGTVSSNPPLNLAAGDFVAENNAVTITATATGSDPFAGWSGDTAGSDNPITLPMDKPYDVVATFAPLLVATPATPPAGVMGAAYNLSLAATGGSGSYSWAVTNGALPPGLTLANNGTVSGAPSDTGSYTADATVTSGGQTDTITLQFTVTEPQLATDNVVNHLLGTASVLTVDELNYLDLVGNGNSGFDIGDFLGWVDRTGATPTASAVASVVAGAAARESAGEDEPDDTEEGRVEP